MTNQEELKKAKEAFGDKLAEYKRVHLEARLVKIPYAPYFALEVGNKDSDGDYHLIYPSGYGGYSHSITYLEPPREPQPMFTEEEIRIIGRRVSEEINSEKWTISEIEVMQNIIKKCKQFLNPQQTEQEEPLTKEQLLAKVPRLEDLPKMLKDGNEFYVVARNADGFDILSVENTGKDYEWATSKNLELIPPKPKKVPWGQAEHLRFALENGGMQECEIKSTQFSNWVVYEGLGRYGISYNGGHFVKFSDITHIRGTDGVEVKCETLPPTEKEGESE